MPARHPDAARHAERAAGAPASGCGRAAGREPRDRARPQGRPPDPHRAHRLADPRRARRGDRGLDDRARHHRAEGSRAAARRERAPLRADQRPGRDLWLRRLFQAPQRRLGADASAGPPAELLPNPFIEIVHPDDREAVEDEVAKLAAGRPRRSSRSASRPATAAGCGRNGRRSPRSDAGVFYCSGREISERMATERVRAAERRQLADAQQIARVGSWEYTPATGRAHAGRSQQYRNHGFDPSRPPPGRGAAGRAIHPDDREAVGFRCGRWRPSRGRSSAPTASSWPTAGARDRHRGTPVRRRRRVDPAHGDEPRRHRRAGRRAAARRLLQPRLARAAHPADLDHRLRGAARRDGEREPELAGAAVRRGHRPQRQARAQPRGRPADAHADHRGHVRDRARLGGPRRARGAPPRRRAPTRTRRASR